eukprot:CAMPEP_0201091946 /NCGR_PEP_ID=MMETSP0812-20130820/479_1 /ASSEMBLY_ACC=CAM_ASM_000668 /TAXON_ID=98059 /ORGANISM="Dinobryon sp., Strain UTEXLB2267" /LENGTH=94 /DNA_ID=CAMNT_0047343205 /DNA_START=81 /DNA_END=362 /DNA_ORIENTATION=+
MIIGCIQGHQVSQQEGQQGPQKSMPGEQGPQSVEALYKIMEQLRKLVTIAEAKTGECPRASPRRRVRRAGESGRPAHHRVAAQQQPPAAASGSL